MHWTIILPLRWLVNFWHFTILKNDYKYHTRVHQINIKLISNYYQINAMMNGVMLCCKFIFLQFSKNMRKAIAVEIKDSTKEKVSLLSIVYKQKLYIWLNVLVLSMERGWEGWTKWRQLQLFHWKVKFPLNGVFGYESKCIFPVTLEQSLKQKKNFR